MIAKKATPSMSAAEMIIAVWICAAISGWRAMLSTAEAVSSADSERGADDDEADADSVETWRAVAVAVVDGRLGGHLGRSDDHQGQGQGGGLHEFHRNLDSSSKDAWFETARKGARPHERPGQT